MQVMKKGQCYAMGKTFNSCVESWHDKFDLNLGVSSKI